MKKIISVLMILAMLCATLTMALPTFAADVDTDDLEDLIKDAEKLEEDEHTQESWEALVASIAAAKQVLNDQYLTQEGVDAAQTDLQAKIDALVKVTKDYLQTMVDTAKEIENKGFSTESWETFQSAIADAEEFCEDGGSDRDLIKRYVALRDALKEMKYDTTELQKLISTANELADANKYAEKTMYAADGKNAKTYGSDYTKETYATFTAALETAKTNVKSNDFDLIAASVTELGTAIKGLQPNVVPSELINRLNDLLDLAGALTSTDWEDTAWRMVDNKIKQAQSAPQNAKVSTYLKATTELETALKLLTNENKTDNTVLPAVPTYRLEHLIAWCDENLKETGYTAESWTELAAALASAKEIAAAPKRVKEVNAAYDRLFAAKDALVIAEATADGGEDGDGEFTDVGCGGAIATTAVVMTAVLGLGATVVLKKKDN